MTANLITSVLSLATKLLPSITASARAPSSSSNSINAQQERAHAAEEDLDRLMRTLQWIRATLYDADEREIIDRSVKFWLRELKKVCYDAEDLLSEYRYEVTRVQVEARKASMAFSSHKQMESIDYIVPIPAKMVDQLIKIINRFDEIAKDRDALQLRESDGVRRLNNKILPPLTGHMVDEASIFGRDAEIEEVTDFLLSENEKQFSVISIVGKGGLGKTTIAQLVYKDGRLSECFDLFGWVCVSEEFDIRRLIKATIESVSQINNDNGVSELSPLQEKLAKIVNGKNIFLILDDVWNENQTLWELFRVPFKEAKKVRILVTTRNNNVAKVMQTTKPFRPSNLPESSCWQLFQHYAFSGRSDTVATHLVDMGRDIMRKCGGLPLAVKSIASLLRYETYEEYWREILESDLWECNPLNDIFPALQISYVHLPPYLKRCFLFCSMYPKDYILKKMNLIELWISHGYIESRGKRKITEIGVEYYEELKQRSLLDNFSDGSKYEYCKLHDIIHDLARLNSENEHYSVELKHSSFFDAYQNDRLNSFKLHGISMFVDRYENEFERYSVKINRRDSTQNRNVPQDVCHLYARGFVGSVNQILPQNMKSLRTLSFDLSGGFGYLGYQYSRLFNHTKFQSLRVLELKANFNEIPEFIPELKHLIYLGITSSHHKTLPLSVGLLYNLQSLILDCQNLEYLPENIGDLANLQFLNIESYNIKKLPKSLCSLINLQRLVIKCDCLEEVPLDLKNLHKLHELTFFSQKTLALPNTIGCLSNLEKLYLSIGDLDYVPHGLVSFPAIKKMAAGLRVRNIGWIKDMKALEGRLSIRGLEESNLVDAQCANLRNKCKLDALDLFWDHGLDYGLHSVRKPDLGLTLSLHDCEDVFDDADDIFFSLLESLQPHPNLKKLHVRYYPSAAVPGWMRDPFYLQSIQEVWLESCHYIEYVPFRNLHTLKHLTMVACHSIRVVQLEELSSQLEELQILNCQDLESITGLGDLDMLASLRIQNCEALKSLTMDRLQLVESTEIFGDSSHEKPHIGRQNISSLTRMEIKYCYFLCALPVGLIPSGPSCYVRVEGCGCPDLEFGHLA